MSLHARIDSEGARMQGAPTQSPPVNGTEGGDQKRGERDQVVFLKEDIQRLARAGTRRGVRKVPGRGTMLGRLQFTAEYEVEGPKCLVDILPPTSWRQVGDEGLGGCVGKSGSRLRAERSHQRPPAARKLPLYDRAEGGRCGNSPSPCRTTHQGSTSAPA